MSEESDKPYKYVGYSDYLSPGKVLDPIVESFKAGDVAPMVNAINQAQYNIVNCSMLSSPYETYNQQKIAQQVASYTQLIAQAPSITSFYLHLNVNSLQAAEIAQSMSTSNIDAFDLYSNSLSSVGMSDFIANLALTKIDYFCISGILEPGAINEMKFEDTGITTLTFFHNDLPEADFVKLFNNLENSHVDDLSIFGDNQVLTASSTSQIDLSKTDISYLELTKIHFGENALENFHFKDSAVELFWLSDTTLTASDLDGLSHSLQGSYVQEFILSLYSFNDLSHLNLQGTAVEKLVIFPSLGGDYSIAGLDLSGTGVTTLKLSNNFPIEELVTLNFKDTAVEHLDLGFHSTLSLQDMSLLKDLMNDTSIKDITYYDFSTGENKLIENLAHSSPDAKALTINDVLVTDALFDNSPRFETPIATTAPSPIMHLEHPLVVEMAI